MTVGGVGLEPLRRIEEYVAAVAFMSRNACHDIANGGGGEVELGAKKMRGILGGFGERLMNTAVRVVLL